MSISAAITPRLTRFSGDWKAGDSADLTVDEASILAATARCSDLRVAIGQSSGYARALLQAVVAQYDGDVDSAIRLLRRHIRAANDASSRAALAEILAPIYVMRRQLEKVVPLLTVLESGGRQISALSFKVLIAEDAGNRESAKHYLACTLRGLDHGIDDISRFRVLQRLAVGTYFMGQYEVSLDFALSSAALCVPLKAWRAAAAGYSIAYNIHHAVTGDFIEADRFARLAREAAERSEDKSFLYWSLVTEYEMAVQCADDLRIVDLQRQINNKLFPQQYAERFPMVFSNAILKGASNLTAMRTILQVLLDTAGRSRGEIAVCLSLNALSHAAEFDDLEARRLAREAISNLGRVSSLDPGPEQFYRRIARALTASCCILIGDEVRADRIVDVAEMRPDEDAKRIPLLLRTEKLGDAASPLRGVVRVLKRAAELRRSVVAPVGLTQSEFEILKLLGKGWSAGRIATETDRSVNTVYKHSRAILNKFDAARTSEAVAIARTRGLLP